MLQKNTGYGASCCHFFNSRCCLSRACFCILVRSRFCLVSKSSRSYWLLDLKNCFPTFCNFFCCCLISCSCCLIICLFIFVSFVNDFGLPSHNYSSKERKDLPCALVEDKLRFNGCEGGDAHSFLGAAGLPRNKDVLTGRVEISGFFGDQF